MNFTALDIEFNQPSQRIIQIGTAIGDLSTGEIIAMRRIYVNPHEALSSFIITLCGINQEQVDGGVELRAAYEILVEDQKKYAAHCNPITWGGGDSIAIRGELGFTSGERFLFGRRWFDVKTVFQHLMLARGKKIQAGLARAMVRVGLNFKGRKHDAMDDAANTFRLAYHLTREWKV